MPENKIKKIVKKHYSQIATEKICGCSCSCSSQNNEQIAREIGYSDQEIKLAASANLGLGCGNPTALSDIKKDETVLDLGCGAGFDCFLAAKKVGVGGKVIGVDITEEMLTRARINAQKLGYNNVEFRLGDIEKLPIEDESIDVIISNCVINLAPDKLKVFNEAYRVLKSGGRIYLSDIVLLAELTPEQKNNEELIVGCVGGALLKDDYLDIIKKAGFNVEILAEDKDISKKQYHGLPLESLKLVAKKETRITADMTQMVRG